MGQETGENMGQERPKKRLKRSQWAFEMESDMDVELLCPMGRFVVCKLCSVSVNMQSNFGTKNWKIHKETKKHRRAASKDIRPISSFFRPVDVESEETKSADPSRATKSTSSTTKPCPGVYDPAKGEKRLKLMATYGDYANLDVRIQTVGGKTTAHVSNCTGFAETRYDCRTKYYAKCCSECFAAVKDSKSDAYNFLRRLKNLDTIEIALEAMKKRSLCDYEIAKLKTLPKKRQKQPNPMFDALKYQVRYIR